ncbi:hypothetical protein ScPMuIL_012526 [Solemya velum]
MVASERRLSYIVKVIRIVDRPFSRLRILISILLSPSFVSSGNTLSIQTYVKCFQFVNSDQVVIMDEDKITQELISEGSSNSTQNCYSDNKLAMEIAEHVNNESPCNDKQTSGKIQSTPHMTEEGVELEKPNKSCQEVDECNRDSRLDMGIGEQVNNQSLCYDKQTSSKINELRPEEGIGIKKRRKPCEEVDDCNRDSRLNMGIAEQVNNQSSCNDKQTSSNVIELQTKKGIGIENPGKPCEEVDECKGSYRWAMEIAERLTKESNDIWASCGVQKGKSLSDGRPGIEQPEKMSEELDENSSDNQLAMEIAERLNNKNNDIWTSEDQSAEDLSQLTEKELETETPEKSREKLHQCEKCECNFSRKYSLIYHVMSKHMDMKAFSCDICYVSFLSEDELATHQEQHSVDKTQACRLCRSTFTEVLELKGHMRTHAGEQTFICGICNKAFKEKKAMTVHLRKHTLDKEGNCPPDEVLKQAVDITDYIPESTSSSEVTV